MAGANGNGNGQFQITILRLIGVVVVAGILAVAFSGGVGEGAGVISGLVILICTQLFGILQSHRAAVKADTAAVRVAEVAVKQDAATAKATTDIAKVAAQVEEVHVATNSLKDELVDEVRKAAFAAGAKSETDKGNKGAET